MAIERFIWTTHAVGKCTKRLLDRSVLEQSIRDRHGERQINRGDADWRIDGLLTDGRHFAVVYDHPHGIDRTTVRIVSVWDY
jgi:hypothetical protein